MGSTATSRVREQERGYLERGLQTMRCANALEDILQALEELARHFRWSWKESGRSEVLRKVESRRTKTWRLCLRSMVKFAILSAAVPLQTYSYRTKSTSGTRTLIAFMQSRFSAAHHEQVKRFSGDVLMPNIPFLLHCDIKTLFGRSIYSKSQVTAFASAWSIAQVEICTQ